MSAGKIRDIIINTLMNNLSLEIDKQVITIQQYVTRLATQGMSREAIKGMLKRDLADGGPVFGSLKASIQQQVLYAANAGNTDAKVDEFRAEADRHYRWIAVIDKNTCPDCAPRHNQVLTLGEWEEAGLPGTGWSFCREYCRCSLVPEDNLTETDMEQLAQPISKEEVKSLKETRAEGLAKWQDTLKDIT